MEGWEGGGGFHNYVGIRIINMYTFFLSVQFFAKKKLQTNKKLFLFRAIESISYVIIINYNLWQSAGS